jgi:hypothetical protein
MPIDGPDARLLELLERLRDADATVDEVILADGTSRLFVTVPLIQEIEGNSESEAA